VTHLTVIGDAVVDVDVTGHPDRVGPEGCVVLDVSHEHRRPGAAALAAVFAAVDGATVRFVTALGDDDGGRWLHDQLSSRGIEVCDIGLAGMTPEKWRLRTTDGTLLRVDHGCREDAGFVDVAAGASALRGGTDGVLVADYGRGVATRFGAEAAALGKEVPVIWDPHPRGPRPPSGLDLVVPNEREAAGMVGADAGPDARDVAVRLAAILGGDVAVTRGQHGAVYATTGGAVIELPTRPAIGDACGAGDRLAATVAVARAAGMPTLRALSEGIAAATRLVAHGASTAMDGATPLHGVASRHGATPVGEDPVRLAERVRASGGTVVAAGGCFDLLHAGHVELLEAARRLGDCLIVCMNSDRSVRRLKGPGRPIVDEHDRRRLVEALACVDGVVVFDDATPCAALERLRPHVFAKGADYSLDDLPERASVEAWGGRIALLPLAPRRSTTRLIAEVKARAS
jgi:D-beta-D-heptose 7-phosphate kinase/D-beta-D-heptose 1-phosphate adenosyltransferase